MSTRIPSSGVLVTHHAIERAHQRYGLVNIDVRVIHSDVCDALRARRTSRCHPFIASYGAEENCFFVWTEGMKRVYVVRGIRRAYRRGYLKVVTSLPGYRSDDELREEAA
jgi:hypothetical protein